MRQRRKCLSTGPAVVRRGILDRHGVPIRIEPHQLLPQCSDYGCDAIADAWRKLHQHLDQSPAFRAGDKVDALIDRQRRSAAAGLVISGKAFEKAADRDAKRRCDLVECGCAYAVPGVLVFLDLLDADTYGSRKLSLRYVRLDANDRDLPADMMNCTM